MGIDPNAVVALAVVFIFIFLGVVAWKGSTLVRGFAHHMLAAKQAQQEAAEQEEEGAELEEQQRRERRRRRRSRSAEATLHRHLSQLDSRVHMGIQGSVEDRK
ncbi:hypothetical protein F5Y17DRAFT_458156 [Xylariaceae sp. FL0594]|nr:hypothetical protein F5Y17DRAFT_458156 [Xylariaceae sp. FL0594]